MYAAEGGGYGRIRGREKWRMEGKGEVDGKKTVECLRGRLYAERAASRSAREEVAVLSNKVSVLERALAVEIKARDRAERLLRRILEKLESTEVFSGYRPSFSSEVSSVSSSTKCSPIPLEFLRERASSDAASEAGSTVRGNDREASRGSIGTSSHAILEENLQIEAASYCSNGDPQAAKEINREEPESADRSSEENPRSEGGDGEIGEAPVLSGRRRDLLQTSRGRG
ncbi:uncharacterized protein LOC144702051 [Wolffia australiana]